ncbi:DUF4126 domain-containing protein [Gordonia sp. ABSL1-1]|uniref:DUF4126 domain-containing protein n=1 Tax=Gordonia sp. ABSL1-1 TaxID=3053923 RepID=UPI0025734119|nr:DUF4126 domain-containing protein [Gordonia sp. ABSL1-1]MDL9936538.1 DUF4126 domain-containing protein [Gordonia sp. ABSL1-1]
MLELLTGSGLALAAGLNAYIPLIVLGLAGRYLDFVDLPSAAQWLSNGWVLAILTALLVVEVIADKIPVVDTVNDSIQTVIRPTAGGIAFGTGAASETAVVTDPASFFSSSAWIPIAIGVVLALVVHGTKALLRPPVNAVSGGVGAPVMSSIEDAGSVALALFALLAPVLVLAMIVAVGIAVWLGYRRLTSRRHRRRTAVT